MDLIRKDLFHIQDFIILGPDMNSATHTNNKIGRILVFDRDFIQGKNGTAIYVGEVYSVNFTAANKKFCFKVALKW